MKRIQRSDDGFTIIELLVAIFVLSVVSVGFYSVMIAGARSSRTSQDVARVSEEARLGLNRMIRDTREGQLFSNLRADEFNVKIDFDGDGTTTGPTENPNGDGDYENLTYRFTGSQITLNGELLVDGAGYACASATPTVDCPVFTYTSNDLRYDYNGDGLTKSSELQDALAAGYDVDPSDPELYSNVQFEFRVTRGGNSTRFHGQAQLRNRRELISDDAATP